MKKENNICCAECAHYDADSKLCTNASGKLREIELSEGLAEAKHGCGAFQEAQYRATPATLLWVALENNKVKVSMNKAKLILDEFLQSMIKSGYIEEKYNNKPTNNRTNIKSKIRLWIARDKDGILYLHYDKPERDDKEGCFYCGIRCPLPSKFVPEITFENSPQQVELKLCNVYGIND